MVIVISCEAELPISISRSANGNEMRGHQLAIHAAFLHLQLCCSLLRRTVGNINSNKSNKITHYDVQCRSTPTSPPPPKVNARAPAHRSYHFRGVKLKSCIKKIHHNLYISKQANVRIQHADTEGSSHKKFGTDARVQ